MNVMMQKVHGSENDFFLLDETQFERSLTAEEIEQLRIQLCSRKQDYWREQMGYFGRRRDSRHVQC